MGVGLGMDNCLGLMFVHVNTCGVRKGIYDLHNLYSTEEGREIRGRVLQLITWNLYESLCRSI